MPNYYTQMSGRNYGVNFDCVLLRHSYMILFRHWMPSHSYRIVTRMFWECFRNPIYMHLCHIFFISRIKDAICIILAWPIWLPEVHQLLPISYQYMYANFISWDSNHLSTFILYFWHVSRHIRMQNRVDFCCHRLSLVSLVLNTNWWQN